MKVGYYTLNIHFTETPAHAIFRIILPTQKDPSMSSELSFEQIRDQYFLNPRSDNTTSLPNALAEATVSRIYEQ